MHKADGLVCFGRIKGSGRRKEHTSAEQLLKYAAEKFFCMEFDINAIQKQEHGKPYYAKDERVQFNVSHCKDFAAAAVSGWQVGVDVEGRRRVNRRTVMKCCGKEEIFYVFGETAEEKSGDVILTEAESRRFLHLWTLKESYVKMTGEGLRTPFARVCFDLSGRTENAEKQVREILGAFPDCRHFLYLDQGLTAALSVRCPGLLRQPEFLWEFADGKILQ